MRSAEFPKKARPPAVYHACNSNKETRAPGHFCALGGGELIPALLAPASHSIINKDGAISQPPVPAHRNNGIRKGQGPLPDGIIARRR